MSEPNGAMGAGAADGLDVVAGAGGDATGGGSPGDPEAMGSDEGRTVEEGAGRATPPDDDGDDGDDEDDERDLSDLP